MIDLQERPRVKRPTRKLESFPYGPRIEIDYTTNTTPFPEGRYLRAHSLSSLTVRAETGEPVEIVAGDGDGKSTFLDELDRFNCDHGKAVLKIDIRTAMGQGWGPSEMDTMLVKAGYPEKKVILLIDCADELWFKQRAGGKSWAELKLENRRHILGSSEVSQFEALEAKAAIINWLGKHKNQTALFVTAHGDETPSIKTLRDFSLRERFVNSLSNPYKFKSLYTAYSPEDATLLLTHFGVTEPQLVEVLTSISSRLHHDLKALACLKINSESITDYYHRFCHGRTLDQETRVSFEKALKSFLGKAKKEY